MSFIGELWRCSCQPYLFAFTQAIPSVLVQMLRTARLVLIGVAGTMLVAVLAAHAPPARALVLRRVGEALRTSYGVDLRAQSLSYNLLTLSAELREIGRAHV